MADHLEVPVDRAATRRWAMDPKASDFSRLVGQAQGGDSGAANELYRKFGKTVREAVRLRLPDNIRQEYDSLDFAQDVWASFFRQAPADRQFATPEDLSSFLI